MFRGMKTFVCGDCRHTFTAADIELNASAHSMPRRCPKCGSMHTAPLSNPLSLISKLIFKK